MCPAQSKRPDPGFSTRASAGLKYSNALHAAVNRGGRPRTPQPFDLGTSTIATVVNPSNVTGGQGVISSAGMSPPQRSWTLSLMSSVATGRQPGRHDDPVMNPVAIAPDVDR